MLWLIPVFLLLCVFIAKAPEEVTKSLLAGVWALMALSAIGSTIYAIGAVLTSR